MKREDEGRKGKKREGKLKGERKGKRSFEEERKIVGKGV